MPFLQNDQIVKYIEVSFVAPLLMKKGYDYNDEIIISIGVIIFLRNLYSLLYKKCICY